MAKKTKSYIVQQTDLVEGKPVSKTVYNNITLPDIDTWLKTNHPECKAWWIDLFSNPQPVAKIKVPKVDAEGNPVMKEIKHRDGSVSQKQELEEVAAPAGYKRKLNSFEIRDKFLEKFKMEPVLAEETKKVRETLGNW